MATIGIFALNISRRTGGIYSFLEGLMRNARYSAHRFLLLTQTTPPDALPPNVKVIHRPLLARIATQALTIAPGIDRIFQHRLPSIATLSLLTALRPRVFRSADAWLWPHCFSPMPNLPNMAVICHDLIHRHHAELFHHSALARRARAERLLSTCSLVLCPSQATARDLTHAYPTLHTPMRIFPEAPNLPSACEPSAQECHDLQAQFGHLPLFAFIAVDWPHKNHSLLIDAALHLRNQIGPAFRVIFAGYRRTDRLSRLIQQQQAQDIVVDTGPLSARRLATLLRSARAMLFPSLYEGFGIPLVEAMCLGLPIIASNRSSIPEVCQRGAILLPPDSPDRWAVEMRKMIDQPQWREHWSIRAKIRASAFTWQRCWSQLDAAFTSLAAGRLNSPATPPTHAPPLSA